MRDAKATPRGGFVLSERAVRSAQLELGAARTAARAKLARGRSSSQACARAQLESGLRAGAAKTTVFGESLDELANRQRARIWLPLVGSHSGGIVS